MEEILPGVHHWTAFHRAIRVRVSSYYLRDAGVVVDPILPEEGLEAFDGLPRPQQVVLTSGNHTRDAPRFAEAFGIPIRASREGAERIGGALDVELYTAHEDVAPGVRPVHIGILSPDEYALHIDVAAGALGFADGVHHYGQTLSFFADELLGDDPQEIKAGLKERLRSLLERDFDHLLFAHGDPIVGHGRTTLREFVKSPLDEVPAR